MPETYKKLGSIAPTDDSEYVLYATPDSTQSLVSNITVTNRSSSSASFDINVYDENIGSQGSVLESPLFVVSETQNISQEAAYSTNGVTWTQTTLPVPAYWWSMSYGNGLFFAIGREQDIAPYTSQLAVYSTDAITWTRTTMPVAASWKASAYAFNKWIVSSTWSDSIVATSTNLITWTQGTLPVPAPINYFSSGNNLIVSAPGGFALYEMGLSSRSSASVVYSTDAITWSVSTLSLNSSYDIAYGNNIFVLLDMRGALGYNRQTNFISTNAVSWTRYTMPVLTTWSSISYGKNVFFAATYGTYASQNTISATSTNAITWTMGTMPAPLGNIIYGNNKFFLTSAFVNTNINYISTDAVTWTAGTLPTAISAQGSTYAGQPYTSPSTNNLYKTSVIDANETLILEPGISLSPENSVVVKDNSSGNLTFSTYGVELS